MSEFQNAKYEVVNSFDCQSLVLFAAVMPLTNFVMVITIINCFLKTR